VLTSDHGQLFERGVHGHATALLYEPVIHVPLLISRPSQKQRQDVHLPTSCVDVMPSLLHATGLPIPNWCEGEFLPAFGRAQGSSERSLFSVEAKGNPAYRPLGTGTIALIRGQYKLIHYFGHDGYENEYELYDLTNDPEEMENLYPIWKSIAADLRHELQMKLREVNEPYTK
jgi:arylsulfatase A-like enzyme